MTEKKKGVPYTTFFCDQMIFKLKETARELEKTPITLQLLSEYRSIIEKIERELDPRD